MKKLIKFYRLLNILSIDVALGAICCAAWFAVLFNVNLKPHALISLGLTVWIIYTADHLLDARKIHEPASTERHRYHQKNSTLLVSVLLLAVIVDLFFVFFIRKVVFQWGLVLSGLVVVYFLTQQYLRYLKELIIALLFSFGVLLPALSTAQKQPDVSLILLISQFALTALLNLLLFSWFDRFNDHRDKRKSFVTFMGERKTRRILWLTFILNGTLMIGSILYLPQMIDQVIVIFFMNVILVLIFVQPQRFELDDRFRLTGDSIFLLPLLYLFM